MPESCMYFPLEIGIYYGENSQDILDVIFWYQTLVSYHYTPEVIMFTLLYSF